jgi:GTPase Era involved in 16S rRNA processing
MLGKKVFKERAGFGAGTRNCKMGDQIFDEKRLVVVDAPGFFDPTLDDKVLIPEIASSYEIAAPGPHAFLIVLAINRFTPEEEAGANWICKVFDERALDYCIVVFTGLDNLKRQNTTIEDAIMEGPPNIKKFLKKCGDRYIAVDNFSDDAEKTQTRLNLIEKMVKMVEENGGQFYNNRRFIQIGRALDKHHGVKDSRRMDRNVDEVKETMNTITNELFARDIYKRQP